MGGLVVGQATAPHPALESRSAVTELDFDNRVEPQSKTTSLNLESLKGISITMAAQAGRVASLKLEDIKSGGGRVLGNALTRGRVEEARFVTFTFPNSTETTTALKLTVVAADGSRVTDHLSMVTKKEKTYVIPGRNPGQSDGKGSFVLAITGDAPEGWGLSDNAEGVGFLMSLGRAGMSSADYNKVAENVKALEGYTLEFHNKVETGKKKNDDGTVPTYQKLLCSAVIAGPGAAPAKGAKPAPAAAAVAKDEDDDEDEDEDEDEDKPAAAAADSDDNEDEGDDEDDDAAPAAQAFDPADVDQVLAHSVKLAMAADPNAKAKGIAKLAGEMIPDTVAAKVKSKAMKKIATLLETPAKTATGTDTTAWANFVRGVKAQG